MKAFLNDPEVKKTYIARINAHALADEIVKGEYWENGKGCAVGCTIHGGNHADYEKLLGIPRQLAHLQDFIFESLPDADAKQFPQQFLSAIRVGADLSKVWDKFHVWLLLDANDGLVAVPDKKKETIGWIRDVAVLYSASAEGRMPTKEEKELADRAARAGRDAWDAWGAIKKQRDQLLKLLAEAK